MSTSGVFREGDYLGTPRGVVLKKDCYQVFLMTCPAPLPISFAAHPWFVVNKLGAVSRWEVGVKSFRGREQWEYVHKDAFPLFQGVPMLHPLIRKPAWNSRLEGHLEGGEGSLAAQLVECIEASPATYPYTNSYNLLGPNSNTYAEWILRQSPQSGLSLPWNAYGKDWKP
jgi:hypothetical protein